MEAETQVSWPPGAPGAGRGRKDHPHSQRREHSPEAPWLWTLAAYCERIKLCCFKPPSLWGFVWQPQTDHQSSVPGYHVLKC